MVPPPARDSSAAASAAREKVNQANRPSKRRCVSNACIACRRRKSKCDGNTPACAACASVYHTECVYDPTSDHRRKGVYKKDIDKLRTQNSTLQTLIEAILNYPDESVYELVQQIRTCDSLEDLAESIVAENAAGGAGSHGWDGAPAGAAAGSGPATGDSPESNSSLWAEDADGTPPSLEAELSGKLGQLRLEEGQVRFIGATSNLILVPGAAKDERAAEGECGAVAERYQQDPVTSWTEVTDSPQLVVMLVNLYFTWHYPYFTTLSKDLFYRDFLRGRQALPATGTAYCSPLLVNAILALGCHFTAAPGSRLIRDDPATAGDHFFKEAKRLILEHDEAETPRLTTVQALALMSVREAGCGREARGWLYSGMSFRMAMDLGLHLDPATMKESESMRDDELDARRVTFWGCFLFDKCWSNYMGRMPQLPSAMVTVPKYDVFPGEDSDDWLPYTGTDVPPANAQPSRIRAVSLQITNLCEISNDILLTFYNPTPPPPPQAGKTLGAAGAGGVAPGAGPAGRDFKHLSELFTRLSDWRKKLPPELDAREGALPSTLVMHMFHQTLYIHLFRPFLRYSSRAPPQPSAADSQPPHPAAPGAASTPPAPTPLSHLDPRKACLAAATTLSKLLRFYRRRYGLRQICNVAGYFIHSACTIHLLNLPAKPAQRDLCQGLCALEEMGNCWLVARRSLVIVDVLVRRWGIVVPEEAARVLARARERDARRFGLEAKDEGEGRGAGVASVTGSGVVVGIGTAPGQSVAGVYGLGQTAQLRRQQQAQTKPQPQPPQQRPPPPPPYAQPPPLYPAAPPRDTAAYLYPPVPTTLPASPETWLPTTTTQSPIPTSQACISTAASQASVSSIPSNPPSNPASNPALSPTHFPSSPASSDAAAAGSQEWWLRDQNALGMELGTFSAAVGAGLDGVMMRARTTSGGAGGNAGLDNGGGGVGMGVGMGVEGGMDGMDGMGSVDGMDGMESMDGMADVEGMDGLDGLDSLEGMDLEAWAAGIVAAAADSTTGAEANGSAWEGWGSSNSSSGGGGA